VGGIVLPRTVVQTVGYERDPTNQRNFAVRDALTSQMFQQLGALVPGRDVDYHIPGANEHVRTGHGEGLSVPVRCSNGRNRLNSDMPSERGNAVEKLSMKKAEVGDWLTDQTETAKRLQYAACLACSKEHCLPIPAGR
jgi:hypothetical protein